MYYDLRVYYSGQWVLYLVSLYPLATQIGVQLCLDMLVRCLLAKDCTGDVVRFAIWGYTKREDVDTIDNAAKLEEFYERWSHGIAVVFHLEISCASLC